MNLLRQAQQHSWLLMDPKVGDAISGIVQSKWPKVLRRWKLASQLNIQVWFYTVQSRLIFEVGSGFPC
jgi:hypothetical protein